MLDNITNKRLSVAPMIDSIHNYPNASHSAAFVAIAYLMVQIWCKGC